MGVGAEPHPAPRSLLGCTILVRGDSEGAPEKGTYRALGEVVGWEAGVLEVEGEAPAPHPLAAPPPGAAFELRSPEPAPLLAARILTGTGIGDPLPHLRMRLATTRGTNRLLERKGEAFALVVTRGFGDLLRIGDQTRPDLFALHIERPPPLAAAVVEVEERRGAGGEVVRPLSREVLEALEAPVADLLARGIRGAAVVLAHAWRHPEHEEAVAAFLRERGMDPVVTSAETAPVQHLLHRGETTAAEAFLAPGVGGWLARVAAPLDPGALHLMTSAGGLVRGERVRATETLLSGPAAGVLGAARGGEGAGFTRLLTFDMGGTSTDVARHDGAPDWTRSHQVGEVRLRTPALAIETVAAGGGSLCRWTPDGLAVGPESAGADPGPACYGAGGPLTLTDVNLLLGRLDPARMGIPVEEAPARARALEVLEAAGGGGPDDLPALLEGFVALADERMADAIRRISERRGHDPAEHALVAFGGAGPQHACGVAARLGIREVVIPPDAGILSAVGLRHAPVERHGHREVLRLLAEVEGELPAWVEAVEGEAREAVEAEGIPRDRIRVRSRTLLLRYRGQEATVEVPWPGGEAAFHEAYEATWGHRAPGRAIEVAGIRVVAGATLDEAPLPPVGAGFHPAGRRTCRVGGRWEEVPVLERKGGAGGIPGPVDGPALLLEPHAGIFLPPGWRAHLDRGGGGVVLEAHEPAGVKEEAPVAAPASQPPLEEVAHALAAQRLEARGGEVGARLERTALSVNIRERLDFSCALLDREGYLVAHAPHIPVHLGALGVCTRALVAHLDPGPGDVMVTNHPAFGGSHLPDVTVVTPVHEEGGMLLGYLANRAHHAEIGGERPGSMPPHATTLAQEGVVLPPTFLVRRGEARWEAVESLLRAPPEGQTPSRAVEENRVDLAAQVAANHRGAALLRALAREMGGGAPLARAMAALRRRAAHRMEVVLDELAAEAGAAPGEEARFHAREELDDGTPLEVAIRIRRGEEGEGHPRGTRAHLDFAGSGPVHPGNLNATEAIVRSAVLYLLRVLAGASLPLNEGLLEPVTLHLPPGETFLAPAFDPDPTRCPAVVGGNTETSQRLVDALLRATGRVAGSQGTMNNVLFGNASLGYYETIGGGSGAGPGFHGASGVQVHMTNTRITDVEVLEHRYPVRVERFALRPGSGGEGRWRGGDGIVRELRFLAPLELSLLGQHRVVPPYALAGGSPGAVGRQWVIRASGALEPLPSLAACRVEPGDRLVVETPGGGGYGAP